MASLDAVELKIDQLPYPGVHERIMNGEFFMLRQCLQELGIFETLVQASYKGITEQVGKDKADQIMSLGFDQIHKVLTADEIPQVTDAVYDAIEPDTFNFLKKFTKGVIGETDKFYFERKANVRFHIPHDLAAPFLNDYHKFSKRRGDGKITPHRAHRDSWVDCPANLINVWIAVGEVITGNSLTIYPETYEAPLQHEGPYIAADENPGAAVTFDMKPGDVLLFHGDQVHGSEINVTDSTRHVISFRIILEKPLYTNGHYHHYVWSPLAGGMTDFLGEIPQNMAWSFFSYKIFQVNRKLKTLLGLKEEKSGKKTRTSIEANINSEKGIPLADISDGSIVPWSKSICVALSKEGEVKAFSRYCTHEGADLAYGVMKDGQVKCPFHNLSINPETGISPCQSLKHLKVFPVEVIDGRVWVLEKAETT